MKTFIVWMHNKTSSKDDEPIKVKAKDKDHAAELARNYQPERFYVGTVYALSAFKKETGWPHTCAIDMREKL